MSYYNGEQFGMRQFGCCAIFLPTSSLSTSWTLLVINLSINLIINLLINDTISSSRHHWVTVLMQWHFVGGEYGNQRVGKYTLPQYTWHLDVHCTRHPVANTPCQTFFFSQICILASFTATFYCHYKLQPNCQRRNAKINFILYLQFANCFSHPGLLPR